MSWGLRLKKPVRYNHNYYTKKVVFCQQIKGGSHEI